MANRDWAAARKLATMFADHFDCEDDGEFVENATKDILVELRQARADGRRDWMLAAADWHDNASTQCLPENVAFHQDCAGTLRLVHKLEEDTRRALAQQDGQ